ncbi:MAG: heme biosynthesis HemY N-terminal domain-containing protein [Burkholderiaceae bacterium]
MRLIIKLLVVLALAAGLGLLIRYHEGSVTISLPPDTYDLAPNELALGILAMFVIGYFVIRTLIHLFTLPETLASWIGGRRRRKAQAALHDLVLAMHEGDLKRVDELAELAQRDESTAAAAALMAARAAHMNDELVRRNEWLQRSTSVAGADRARIMFAAETALDDQRPVEALAILARAPASLAASLPLLRLKLRALQGAEQWRDALETARQLQRKRGLSNEAFDRVREQAFESLFEGATDAAEVDALYQQMSRDDAGSAPVIEAAAEAFARTGEEMKSLRVIERILETRLSPPALVLFTRLNTIPPRERLRLAERWQRQYDDDALILATLGRLCIAEGLWGKAEECLRAADARSPSPFTRLALAEMYEALRRERDASQLYKDIARDPVANPVLAPMISDRRLPG